MDKIRIHHGKEFEAFELQTDEIPCKLIAAVFYQKNDEHRLVLAEAEKYASLFAAAPALLEACNKALIAFRAMYHDIDKGTVSLEDIYGNELYWPLKQLRAAIALVEKEG